MTAVSDKENIKRMLVESLAHDPEVDRIIIFGSFVRSDNPGDLDVAVFQHSNESYLPLAMKYRRQTRAVARAIPLDIIPLRTGVGEDPFLEEIKSGEVIYERS